VNTNEYQQQIIRGSRLISEKIIEIAKEANIDITKTKWDGDTINLNIENYHTIEIFTEKNSIIEPFYPEEIAEFPSDSEDVIKSIRRMIKTLKNSAMDNENNSLLS
jgi:hypothetical protein